MSELRKLRRRRRLTQEALAARSGVDQATISGLEGGRRPLWDTAYHLARALGVRPEAVFPVADRGAGDR